MYIYIYIIHVYYLDGYTYIYIYDTTAGTKYNRYMFHIAVFILKWP